LRITGSSSASGFTRFFEDSVLVKDSMIAFLVALEDLRNSVVSEGPLAGASFLGGMSLESQAWESGHDRDAK
jgi:hypothetical protein